MLLPKFDPPGFLNDLTEAYADAWSLKISEWIDEAIAGFPDACAFDAPRSQFFNQTKTAVNGDAAEADILWTAFPRNVLRLGSVSERKRLLLADSNRDLQDEYCEWSVERDEVTKKITKVEFTSEGPEYWVFLAEVDPEKVVALYQQFISPEVTRDDLFPFGFYDQRNIWNNSTVNGAMHLIQGDNTLGAEIELAGGSTVVRIKNGRLLTGERELIDCGDYGNGERHSDPHIGAVVNSFTRQKADVTLANPVGIYFAGLTTTGWETPDDTDPQEFWKYTRGTNAKPVRAEFEVPAELGYSVGDITIDGKPIEFGGQIALAINMKLTGLATRFGQSTTQPMTGCRSCGQADAPVADDSGQVSVAAVLKAAQLRSIKTGRRR